MYMYVQLKVVEPIIHWCRATSSRRGKAIEILSFLHTFLNILAEPNSGDFWMRAIDVSTPMSFRLPFNLKGTVPNAPTIRPTVHILQTSLARS